ncbi:hypothetical protein V1478_017301 [Vespula squamosa]|uniref:Uncharacterized protein n=1 Tax=Vespula squamosa TaxID=30214 RepID=A0ABD1ZXP6_VESSQ
MSASWRGFTSLPFSVSSTHNFALQVVGTRCTQTSRASRSMTEERAAVFRCACHSYVCGTATFYSSCVKSNTKVENVCGTTETKITELMEAWTWAYPLVPVTERREIEEDLTLGPLYFRELYAASSSSSENKDSYLRITFLRASSRWISKTAIVSSLNDRVTPLSITKPAS